MVTGIRAELLTHVSELSSPSLEVYGALRLVGSGLCQDPLQGQCTERTCGSLYRPVEESGVELSEGCMHGGVLSFCHQPSCS